MECYYCHALRESPRVPPAATDLNVLEAHVAGRLAQPGTPVYMDGSAYEGTLKQLTRAGWAFASFDAEGNPTAGSYGALPLRAQTVPNAEAYALLRALLCILAGLRRPGAISCFEFVGDCKHVIEYFNGDTQRAALPMRPTATVWQRIVGAKLKLLAAGIEMRTRWVKAHLTEADIGMGAHFQARLQVQCLRR